jgi:pSer/pThr/pTyr-binding forkhead associated (FHA) protein
MSSTLPDRQLSHTPSSERSDSAKLASLVMLNGPEAGKRIDLKLSEVVLGRDSDAFLCLSDDSVSRRHAIITRVLGRFILFDLESTNGTFVNQRRVERAQLKEGDVIRVGSVTFRFLQKAPPNELTARQCRADTNPASS